MRHLLRWLVLVLALGSVAGCAPPPRPEDSPAHALRADVQAGRIADLAAMIRALGPGVDPQ